MTPRPDWAPEKYWDATKGELKGSEWATEFNRLAAANAADTSRKASVPTADKYELKFNNDYQLPVGTEWTWDGADQAAMTGLRQFANENGLPQEGFSKLLGMYASEKIAETQRIRAAQAQQLELLGPNVNTRVDAVRTYLDAVLGADAKPITSNLYTAAQIQSFEKLIRHVVSQGVSGNPAGARDGAPRSPARLTDDQYAKLTYGEKAAYAAQFDQSRFNGRAPG